MQVDPVVFFEMFEQSDYARVLEVMEDRGRLPALFDDWELKAQSGVRALERSGFTVERRLVRPGEFAAWCEERGLRTDARSRHKFCNPQLQRPPE